MKMIKIPSVLGLAFVLRASNLGDSNRPETRIPTNIVSAPVRNSQISSRPRINSTDKLICDFFRSIDQDSLKKSLKLVSLDRTTFPGTYSAHIASGLNPINGFNVDIIANYRARRDSAYGDLSSIGITLYNPQDERCVYGKYNIRAGNCEADLPYLLVHSLEESIDWFIDE